MQPLLPYRLLRLTKVIYPPQESGCGRTQQAGREQLEEFVEGVFGEEIDAKRVVSLIDGIDGVLHAATLGIRGACKSWRWTPLSRHDLGLI